MTRKMTPEEDNAYQLGYGAGFADKEKYRALLDKIAKFFKGRVNKPTDLLKEIEEVLK